MRKINNWEKVKASDDFERLPAGGYVCTIIHVDDEPSKEYLHIEYDIAEGDHKNHWTETSERFGWWGGDFYRSYKDSAVGMFKGFMNAVEESNPGFKWEWDETALEGKAIGVVLGEEEYIKNDGSVGTRLKVRSIKAAQDIRDKKFRIPKVKKLEEPADAADVPDSMEEITAAVPF